MPARRDERGRPVARRSRMTSLAPGRVRRRNALLVCSMLALAGCGSGENVPTSLPDRCPSRCRARYLDPCPARLRPAPTPPRPPPARRRRHQRPRNLRQPPRNLHPRTTQPPPTTTQPPPTTTQPPPTTGPSAAGSVGSTATSAEEQTPWGWIVAAVLAVGLALVAAFVFGRRAASRKQWRASAVRADTDGTALHDATITALIAAATDNQPTAWSAATGGADALLTDLQNSGGLRPQRA